MKRLQEAANKRIDINVNQAPLSESRFIQCADLFTSSQSERSKTFLPALLACPGVASFAIACL